MRNLRLLVACAAIFALLFAVSCGDDSSNPTTETDCTDGQDNDLDGYADCDDTDCAGHPSCTCNFNSLCEPALGENAANCTDCVTAPVCGNGTCEAGENETNCPADCAVNPCNNDGTCDAGETTANCPNDCPGGDQCVATTDLIQQNGCPGQSCTLTDAAGTIGCGPTGTNADYADCGNGAGCLAGAICASGDGGVTNTCMPFCDTANPTCPGGGLCLFQIATSGGNVGLCGEGDTCDPFAMTGCTGGEACYYASGGSTICATAGTVDVGGACQYLDDCMAGMACVGSPGACAELCDAAFTCTTGTCQGIGTIPNWPDIGYCQ